LAAIDVVGVIGNTDEGSHGLFWFCDSGDDEQEVR
jgi:hypothetical protein